MQAVILVAGQSSRFYPYSSFAHKSLVKILGKTILNHTLEKIQESGISEVILVVSNKEAVEESIGLSTLDIKYIEQKEAGGMGEALITAADLINDDFFLLSGYHVDFGDFFTQLVDTKKDSVSASLLIKKSQLSKTYGYVEVSGGKVTKVIEKPSEKGDGERIVGLYFLPKQFIETLKGVPQDHYSFEKALEVYAASNSVFAVEAERDTVTLKYPWHLLDLKDYLLKKTTRNISQNASISPHATIEGEVTIEDGAIVMEGATIKGPCYIGKNAYVGTNSLLRNGTVVGDGARIGSYMECKNSIIMNNVTTHSGFIGDSIIGADTKLAGYFCTGNVRLDRKGIHATVKGEKIDSERKYLGVMVGKNCTFGIRVSTMPGIIIGNGVTIGPGTVIMNDIPDNKTYYAKFHEIVEK